jgi:hypothetical protein
MAVIKCLSCAVDNTADSCFCRRCGARLLPPEAADTTLAFAVADREDTDSLRRDDAHLTSGTFLVIRSGDDREGEVVPLLGDAFTIGRSPQNDLFLDDVTVSRHHARVIVDADGFLAEDLNSLNGTYVNRKRIERHQIADGDELQIGKFKLEFLHRIEGA